MNALSLAPFRRAASLVVLALVACSGLQVEAPPAMPQNISPMVGDDLVANAETEFVWSAVADATGYEFHLFDRASGDIERYYRRDLRPREVCSEGICRLRVSVSLPLIDDHAWRVRAVNPLGFSAWSRSLFDMVEPAGASAAPIEREPPAEPVPLDSVPPVIRQGTLVDFEWLPTERANSYDFHLFDRTDASMRDEVFDLPVGTVCGADGVCRLRRAVDLPIGAGHAWRVRSVNEFGHSNWSRREFAVE